MPKNKFKDKYVTLPKCLVTPKKRPNADLKLICFPYAGGGVSTYSTWVEHLPVNVELSIVQMPGRGSRMFESAHANMKDVMNELLDIMLDFLNKPYIFFGHSLGSRIAFELMKELQALQHPLPLHFIASGSRGPHDKSNKKDIYNLPRQKFIAELKKLNGTPKAVLENQELMDLFLPLLRADFELADTYCYEGDAIFNCPITVLGGEKDIGISFAQLESWQNFFVQKAKVHMLFGDHFFIDSHKNICLEKVNAIINSALKINHYY
jgi:medium-chain acyl-[acyl-carrier-protein] hydrolase